MEQHVQNIFLVDLQGFKDNNEFVVKELCILSTSNQKIHHYIFKPPFDWYFLSKRYKEQAIWLNCYHHGFSWNEGYLPYSEVYACVQRLLTSFKSDSICVYVKGREKVSWMKALCKYANINCVNLEDIGCIINLNDLEYKNEINIPHCNKHKKVLHCAYQNVLILQDWLTKRNE